MMAGEGGGYFSIFHLIWHVITPVHVDSSTCIHTKSYPLVQIKSTEYAYTLLITVDLQDIRDYQFFRTILDLYQS